jgi:hypothetical protein
MAPVIVCSCVVKLGSVKGCVDVFVSLDASYAAFEPVSTARTVIKRGTLSLLQQ